MKTNLTRTLISLVVLVGLFVGSPELRAAPYDISLSQKNASDNAWRTVIYSPVASGVATFDSSKNPTSTATTGTGSIVRAGSPTFTGTIGAASLSLSSLTSGRVPYATTAGLLTDSAAFTFDGTTLTSTILADQGGTIAAQRNALAPRQGLSFDGSNVAATATLASAPGTENVSVVFDFDIPTAGTARGIFHLATARGITTAYELYAELSSANALTIYHKGTTGGDYIGLFKDVSSGYSGRVKGVFTRSGSTAVLYLNGVNASASTIGPVGSGAWADTINGTLLTVGRTGDVSPFTGVLALQVIENRAFSAAEVLALYQTGTVPASDINNASNTSLITGDNSTFTGGVGSWTGIGAGSIVATAGKGVITCASYSDGAFLNNVTPLVLGHRYKFIVDVSSLVGGTTLLFQDAYGNDISTLTAGTNSIEFVASATTSGIKIIKGGGATQGSIDNVLFYNLGALVLPESNALGSGTTWRDVSGNAANITWSSGVNWLLPASGYLNAFGQLSGKGTTTNDNAAAGYIGEYVSAQVLSSSAVTFTTGVRANVTSLALTAGDWDVRGFLGILPSGGATATYEEGSFSDTSATIGAEGARAIYTFSTTAQTEVSLPTTRFSVASTTTIYLVATSVFPSGTVKGFGQITARRIR